METTNKKYNTNRKWQVIDSQKGFSYTSFGCFPLKHKTYTKQRIMGNKTNLAFARLSSRHVLDEVL